MLRFALLWTMCLPLLAGTTAHAQGPTGPKPLFASFEPLAITLTGDMKEVFSNRDTTKVEWVPATLSLGGGRDAAGASTSISVELSTRGHFRLNPSNCKTPPLRVRFPSEGPEGGLWAGQGSLKLVTHCRDKYDELVLQEYLAYRIYNLLTEMSLLPRLARITYANTGEPDKAETYWGFFLEDDDDLAARFGARLVEETGVTFEIADSAQSALMAVFFYMIGNTDWSLPYLHNVKVLDRQLRYYPVPYDFDWSGLVNPPYARPDPRLRIRSVRQRLYRGPCYTSELMAATLARVIEQRDAIRAEYESLKGMDGKKLAESLEYLDEFFDIAENPAKANRELRGVCSR